MGVTIQQIAERSGVSKATVSRVLNGLAVKRETEDRVKEIMLKLQYRPNRFARGLSNQQTGFLGIITPPLNPFVATVLAGIEEEARLHGKLITLGVFRPDGLNEKEAIHILASPPVVDGLLFLLPTPPMEGMLKALIRKGFPAVVAAERRYDELATTVVIDNVQGGRQAVRHLVEKGHRRIGFIKGRDDTSDSADRLEGYKSALAEAGIPTNDDWVLPGDYRVASGEEAGARFLEMTHPPTAVFAANDGMAIGVLKTLRARKREGAFAVMGFDDIEMAELVNPSLTTIGYDLYELGKQSVHKLMRQIKGEEKGRSLLLLKTHLVVRESA